MQIFTVMFAKLFCTDFLTSVVFCVYRTGPRTHLFEKKQARLPTVLEKTFERRRDRKVFLLPTLPPLLLLTTQNSPLFRAEKDIEREREREREEWVPPL